MTVSRPDSRDQDNLGRLKRALAVIDRLEAELAAARRGPEPIAIVGMGCRLPGGVAGPEDYWHLLLEGTDATGEVPPDRWDAAALHDADPERAGFVLSRRGGFVEVPRAFDAAFFGISPREAASIDPQQRLLLEVTWEALERGGIDPRGLQGSATAVFTAICGQDYGQMLAARGLEPLDAYYASGNVHAMASGRISYLLGLQGPSLSIDTACSSSLVAVHLACRSLRDGECDLALAGGVNLILSPLWSVTFSRARMLAGDGRCKAFDASADGYGRAEGCGVVVLKRLSDALADGDAIEAVIRGSAVNQDGAASGLTVPNGPAQQAVIRAALAAAGAGPEAVGYVEAHGTGTALGDPIELGALGAVLGEAHAPDDPLWVGSVKTNIGHAEGAAGIAGLIKAALVLRHGEIPPHLHFRQPNPHADWKGGRLAVPTAAQPWPAGRSLAGVSSFGFSGTNAHVLLEAPPACEAEAAREAEAPAAGPALLTLSARTPAALEAAAARLAEHLEAQPGLDLATVCATLARRTAFEHRLALVAGSTAEAAERLRRPGDTAPVAERGRLVLLFTGQGALRGGEGRELYEREPAFRATIDRCAEAMAGELDLPAALFAPETDTGRGQPALFALQLGLLALWRSWGLKPWAVVGHSVGEYAAAVAAGILDLETAAQLVAARGRLMQALPPGGAMASLAATPRQVEALLVGRRGLEIAAENGPAATVVSGRTEAVAALLVDLEKAGVAATRLRVGHAFHSALMEPVLEPFRTLVDAAPPAGAQTLLYASTLSGRIERDAPRPDYWVEQLRRPVRFAAALEALAEAEAEALLEIGPAPVLSALAGQLPATAALPHAASLPTPTPTPAGEREERRTLLEAAAALWSAGVPLDRAAVAGGRRRPLPLPTYPWQRSRHWIEIEPPAPRPAASGTAAGQQERGTQVGGFYDALTAVFDDYTAYGAEHPEVDLFLTYAPFPAILPGFSWIDTVRRPRVKAEHLALMLERQRELRALAFRHVDFAEVRSVLDFGCGYGADLIALARRHPHLRLTGQTVSPRQAEIGRAAAARAGLDDRIALHVRDSAADLGETARHGLLFGFEVAHHIADKPALFRNLGRQLEEGGKLVLADFIALGGLEVEDDKTLSGFPTREEWVALLSPNGLLLDDIVDISGEVANFLHDPALDRHLEDLRLEAFDASVNAQVREAFRGFVRLGGLLRGGLAAYVLITATRRADLAPGELAHLNGERIERLIPYREASPEGWLYEPVWHPADGADLPAPEALAARLSERPAPAADFDRLAALRAGLDRLAGRYARSALQRLDPREVAPARRRAFARLTEIAADAEPGPPGALAADLRAALPEGARELELLQRCGEGLAQALKGELDPLELLLGDDGALLAYLYREAPTARLMNELAAAAVREIVACLPRGRPLRVLEIGAGTGGTAAALLPLLPAGSDYRFTDLSPQFLARMTEAVGDWPGLRGALFDVERDPASQGLGEESFDLVVAANALHATRDLVQSLRHAAALLAPGGLLLLLEGTGAAPWVDATFGLTDGWWRFEDHDRRRHHPLLDSTGWREAFVAAGLEPGAVLEPATGGRSLPLDQAVMVTRRPAAVDAGARSPGGEWLLLGGGPLATDAAAGLGPGALRVESAEAAAEVLGSRPWRGLVDLRATQTTDQDAPQQALALAAESLDLLQRLGRGPRAIPLWLVTRGAVAGDGQNLPAPAEATIWGLGRVAALEHPELNCRLLDLDPAAEDPAAGLVASLAAEDAEDQIAWRDGRRLVQRLVRRPWPAPRSAGPLVRGEGSYLITGGLGGLGLAVAGRLVERGARRLLLVGRSAPTAAQEVALEALRVQGATVEVHRLDVTDRRALQTLVAQTRDLRGVVHTAGLLEDAALLQLDEAALARVMAPKVSGAWALHQATRDLPLDWFVLFSSVAGPLGNAGQGNHAAANAFLDALARHRRALGLPALAIDWGAWSAVGAAAREAAALPGVSSFAPAQGLDLFERLLAEDASQALVLPVGWPRYVSGLSSGRVPPLLTLLLEPGPSRSESPAAAEEPLDLGDPQAVRHYLDRQAGRVLGLPAGVPDQAAPLTDFGFDSLMAISLRNRVRADMGVDLPMAEVLGGASVLALAEAVARQSSADEAAAGLGDEFDAMVAAMSDEEVEAEMLRLLGREVGRGAA